MSSSAAATVNSANVCAHREAPQPIAAGGQRRVVVVPYVISLWLATYVPGIGVEAVLGLYALPEGAADRHGPD